MKSTTSILYCLRPRLAVFGQPLAGQDFNCGPKPCLSDETSSPRWLKSVQITVRCADLLWSAGGCSLGPTAVDRAIRESAFPAAGLPAGSLRWLIRAVPIFRKLLRYNRLGNRADGPLSSNTGKASETNGFGRFFVNRRKVVFDHSPRSD